MWVHVYVSYLVWNYSSKFLLVWLWWRSLDVHYSRAKLRAGVSARSRAFGPSQFLFSFKRSCVHRVLSTWEDAEQKFTKTEKKRTI